MPFVVKSKRYLAAASLGLLLGLAAAAVNFAPAEVAFESLESKTQSGGAVFNHITLTTTGNQDTWVMQQSHHGLHEPHEKWDRLAIVVDKTTTPKRAAFFQLQPGQLAFEPDAAIPLKARCHACHANGPRAVRPAKSSALHLSWKDNLAIALWNLRIKTYGTIESAPAKVFKEGVPFKATAQILSRPLQLGSCTSCHAPGKVRNELKLEHAGTAASLVNAGAMPPFPFTISKEDHKALSALTGS